MKKSISILLIVLLVVESFLMFGCSAAGTGVAGGAARGIIHEGVYQKCGGSGGGNAAVEKITEDQALEYANREYTSHAIICVGKSRGYTDNAIKGILSYYNAEGSDFGFFSYESYYLFGPLSGNKNDVTLDNAGWRNYCENPPYSYSANTTAFGISIFAHTNHGSPGAWNAHAATEMIDKATEDGYYWQDPQWAIYYNLDNLEARTYDSDFIDPKTFSGSAEEYARRVTAFVGMPGWTWTRSDDFMARHTAPLSDGRVDQAWESYDPSNFKLATFGKPLSVKDGYVVGSAGASSSSGGGSSAGNSASTGGTATSKEIEDYSEEFEKIANAYKGSYSISLGGSKKGSYRGSEKQKASSLINLVILGAFMQKVNDGKLGMYDTVKVKGEEKQLMNLAQEMISQNSSQAANALIDKVDKDYINKWANNNGCKNTELKSKLPDKKGENYTTADDMVNLLEKIRTNKFVNEEMSTNALAFLNSQTDSNGIGAGLGGAKFGHKTGYIEDKAGEGVTVDEKEEDKHNDGVFNDCGIVQTASPFSVCILGQGAYLDYDKQNLSPLAGAAIQVGQLFAAEEVEVENVQTTKTGNSCDGYSSAGGNSSIAEAAVTVAYDPNDRSKYPMENKGCGYACSDSEGIVGYYNLCKDVGIDHGGTPYVCECSTLTPVAIRWAGADDNFPSFTGTEITYASGSDKWEEVGMLFGGKQVEDLKPGDVLVNDQHTWVFCGNEEVQKRFPGSTCDSVGASLGDHTPTIQSASGYTYATWHIYRNVKPEQDSKYKDVKLSGKSGK